MHDDDERKDTTRVFELTGIIFSDESRSVRSAINHLAFTQGHLSQNAKALLATLRNFREDGRDWAQPKIDRPHFNRYMQAIYTQLANYVASAAVVIYVTYALPERAFLTPKNEIKRAGDEYKKDWKTRLLVGVRDTLLHGRYVQLSCTWRLVDNQPKRRALVKVAPEHIEKCVSDTKEMLKKLKGELVLDELISAHYLLAKSHLHWLQKHIRSNKRSKLRKVKQATREQKKVMARLREYEKKRNSVKK